LAKQNKSLHGTIVQTKLIGPFCVEVIAKLLPGFQHAGPGLLDTLSYIISLPNYGGITSYYLNRTHKPLPQQCLASDEYSKLKLAKFTFSEFQSQKIDDPTAWPWVRPFTIVEQLYHQISSGDQISVERDDGDVFIRRKKEKPRPHIIKITNDKNELVSDTI